MKYLILLLLAFIAACAYVAGNGDATVRIDTDSTIKTGKQPTDKQIGHK
jgi:hypothetical protein